MAALSWDGQRYRPIASEGGHADFAPNSEIEIDLWRYLNQNFGGHVSYERALSGNARGSNRFRRHPQLMIEVAQPAVATSVSAGARRPRA